ncbi:unnamed protein product [Thlaspi arvense]|uniref:MADS-box domain-containing protein n=1 Tax=Thlaspi arvense TaxID=13288 RepID=A0AAU9SAE9_THLAR|nr:unnamed protein product [Thlaspi arvense]
MRSSPSSACTHSSSSSSSNSLAATSLTNRVKTIFKKGYELTTLCALEACVIHYGPDGEIKTWPEYEEKVRDLALRYSQLDEAKRLKKNVNLYGFLKKKKNKTKTTNLKKKVKTNDLKRRFLEAQNQKKTNVEALKHQQLKTQYLNPNQFSLFMYNHEDATLSQIPLSVLKNQELHGHDQSMCMSGVTNSNNNFHHPCATNTHDYAALPSGLNHLMQEELHCCDQSMSTSDVTSSSNFQTHKEELHGHDQSMCTSDVTNSSVLSPCLSNTASDELCSDFQDPYGNMLRNLPSKSS